MVHARVVGHLGKHTWSLAVAQVPVSFESVELPSDEHVLEFVTGSCDHRSTPVDVEAKTGKVFLSNRREEL